MTDEVIGVPFGGSADKDGNATISGLGWSFPVKVKIACIAFSDDSPAGGGAAISIELNGRPAGPQPFPGAIDVSGDDITDYAFTMTLQLTGLPPGKPVRGTASVSFE